MVRSEKKEQFDAALDRFCQVMDSSNEAARIFNKLFRNNGPIKPVLLPNSDITYASDSIQPWFFVHAIQMYRRRQDSHKDETGLLFDPKTLHVKMLRYMIDLVKSECAAGSKESEAADQIANALDDVQQHVWLPRGVKQPAIPLKIEGYEHGVVTRHFGDYQKGQYGGVQFNGDKVTEMGTEWLYFNLLERNALVRSISDKMGSYDIAAIAQDGSVQQFNFSHNSERAEIMIACPAVDDVTHKLANDNEYMQHRYGVQNSNGSSAVVPEQFRKKTSNESRHEEGYVPLDESKTHEFEETILAELVKNSPSKVQEYHTPPVLKIRK